MLRGIWLVSLVTSVIITAGYTTDLATLTNSERSNALPVSADLSALAEAHAESMAAANDLFHNSLLGQQVTGWVRVGENVGVGPSISSIHDAFMESERHRRNILDPDWTDMGVGVTEAHGRIWVVVIFRERSQAEEPAPSPPQQQPSAQPKAEPSPEPSPTPTMERYEAPEVDRVMCVLEKIEKLDRSLDVRIPPNDFAFLLLRYLM